MAERESTQKELLRHTVELIGRVSSRTYPLTADTDEWSIGSGAYYDLAGRLNLVESAIFREIPRMMQQLRREIERSSLRDTIPAAASAEYEWHSEIMKTKETVTNMCNTFDEPEIRLSYHVKLIDHSDELLKLARAMGNRYLREAVLTLHDALCGTYSEDLTIEQVETIKSIVNQLQEIKWDRQAVRALDKLLRQKDFETVPSEIFMRSSRERSKVCSEVTLP